MGKVRRGIVATGLGVGTFIGMYEGISYSNEETKSVQACANALGGASTASEVVLVACNDYLGDFAQVPVTLNSQTKGVAYKLPTKEAFLGTHLEQAKNSDRRWYYAELGTELAVGAIVALATYGVAETIVDTAGPKEELAQA